MKLFRMKLTNGDTRQVQGRDVKDVLRRMHINRHQLVYIVPI